ncbi:MAG: hypothetical protein DME22_13920 [Verrucomicrobia bacterium]|nr:MAG: hypothetical protein DME22_13920 [Verrucomicrobiota bacterium]
MTLGTPRRRRVDLYYVSIFDVRPPMRTRLLIAFVTLFTVTQSFGKVTSIQFSNLVANCELIVVAKVESVSSPLIGKRYAKAKVTEVWKGTNTMTVEFLASPTWTCDISEAKKGETVLLFLTRSAKSRSYAIAHSGRGRLPLRTVAGKSYATFWPDVILPKATATIDGPEPKWDFIRSVEMTTLRGLVTRAPQKTHGTEQ